MWITSTSEHLIVDARVSRAFSLCLFFETVTSSVLEDAGWLLAQLQSLSDFVE